MPFTHTHAVTTVPRDHGDACIRLGSALRVPALRVLARTATGNITFSPINFSATNAHERTKLNDADAHPETIMRLDGRGRKEGEGEGVLREYLAMVEVKQVLGENALKIERM